MKQSIGTIWITGLVITFMLIFVGYLTFMLSFSDTEKTKNDILSIIEKRNGFTNLKPREGNLKSVDGSKKNMYFDYGTIQTINLYLKGRGYTRKGNCTVPSGETWYGVDKLDFNINTKITVHKVTLATSKEKKYYYCFTKVYADEGKTRKNGTPVTQRRAAYYKIMVFYKFDLPILPTLSMPVEGKTHLIALPSYCEMNEFRKNSELPAGKSFDSLCPSKSRRLG